MDSFIELVCKAHEANEIDSIVVRAYASPDGQNEANNRLARLRCRNIAELIASRTDIDPAKIRSYPEGVAWNELRRIVYENKDVPSREKIIDILDNVPLWIYDSKGQIVDGRKKRLMEVDHGFAYRWLYNNVFPQLRNAVAVALYTKSTDRNETAAYENVGNPDSTDSAESAGSSTTSEASELIDATVAEDTSGNSVTSITEYSGSSMTEDSGKSLADTFMTANSRPFYLAVKTNMLFDAALVPNLGAEFYLGKNLSLYGDWMYAWWDNDSRHRYWHIYGGDLGLRWWFGKRAHEKPLSGHHVGIYGGVLTFDLEFGDTGYMGGKPGGTLWDRCLVNTGIEYGYSLPIGSRLNIDFSIGLGYIGGNYIKYFPFDNDYYVDKEYKLRFFGPTKAEISLVWLIGKGNKNIRKGGDR
ncbi:MAG: DUF3575 domain-containing protein [Muribaculaceae bacterium]|nr:DUF3575 domain-containing protein [Muribaculaceae bacterium]